MPKFRSAVHGQPKSSEVQQLSFRKGNTICNLCRAKENLTHDHIPPQCCGNDKEVVARRIYADEMVAKQYDVKGKNGLKYRAVCKKCNGEVIGSRDDALGEFALISQPLAAPAPGPVHSVNVDVRAGAVLRSILGHFEGKPLDPNVKVDCWLYPFHPIVVARDFTFVKIEGQGGKSPGLVSVIKFYPLAFCLLDGDGSLDDGPVTALHPFSMDADDAHRDVAIWRQPMLRPSFPERTYGNHMVMGGRTYADSVTTVGGNGFKVTEGKQAQAEAWDGGDPKNIFNGLHAFIEVPET